MTKKEKDNINKAFDRDDYKMAAKILKREIKNDPANHWLITKLSSALYESGKYIESLSESEKALKIMPECPLVLWDYANSLSKLEKTDEAIGAFRKIIYLYKSVEIYEDCWEDKNWAMSIMNDSIYELATLYQKRSNISMAKKYILLHFVNRYQGVRSIYSMKDAKKLFVGILTSSSNSLILSNSYWIMQSKTVNNSQLNAILELNPFSVHGLSLLTVLTDFADQHENYAGTQALDFNFNKQAGIEINSARQSPHIILDLI